MINAITVPEENLKMKRKKENDVERDINKKR
jgi:hypothetical protein